LEFNMGGFIFPALNSTEGIAVELYLSGCSRQPRCKGCHNPKLWDYNYGTSVTLEEIIRRLREEYKDADSIAIMGGEPLDQQHIETLLKEIKTHFPEKMLWLYTSYELHEIIEGVKKYADFIKTGRYIEELACKGRLASSNQRIWKKEKDVFLPFETK